MDLGSTTRETGDISEGSTESPRGFVGNPCKPSKMPLLLGEGVDQSYIVEDCAIDVDSIVVSGSP